MHDRSQQQGPEVLRWFDTCAITRLRNAKVVALDESRLCEQLIEAAFVRR
jgi:hypothetical protein